jgi:transcriptional regulator with XRE-family HTH domain
MKQRREACELSQTQLGEKLGVSFQQVQKYERGTNRLSASMMWAACSALDCDPSYFFDGLDHG